MAKKKVRISRWDELRTLVLVIAVTVVPVAGTVFVVFASILGRESSSNKPVQVLSYMMDGDRPVRQGELVQDFVVLPEAGNLLHPAIDSETK